MALIGKILRGIGDAVLWVLSGLGAICIVLVILAVGFNLNLIMFKTGSMSPTIPAGSVALVKEIPASKIEIGDIVTVDIEGHLPITHRVTSVAPGPNPEQRIITMRGDANETDDAAPYTVSTVRIVLGSVPELAKFIVWISHPIALASITVGASLIVTWAFWPRRRQDDEPPDPEQPHDSGPNHAPERSKQTEPRHVLEHGRHIDAPGRHGGAAIAAVLLTAALAAGGVLSAAPPAAAVIEEEVVHGTYLTLTSLSDSAMHQMSPGATVHWQVGITVTAPEPGEVHVALSGTGSDHLGLGATVQACSVPWVGDTCSGQSWPQLTLDPLPIDGIERPLLTMPSIEQRWLLFNVTMPEGAQAEPGDHVSQQIHATGHGETVVVGPGDIATTGTATDMRGAIMLAVGAVVVGLLIALLGHLGRLGRDGRSRRDAGQAP